MAAEKLGIPAVTIGCPGFPAQISRVGAGSGYPDLRTVEYPAPISLHSYEEMRDTIVNSTVPAIIAKLTEPVESTVGKKKKKREPDDEDIVFEGTYEEVQDYFILKKWGDGLPIVPPTIAKINEFLNFTDREPNEVLGIVPPAMNACTVWKVAVNGVMAGCRPEYMPILLAVAEVICDPEFSVKDSGATPGWEAIITLNGPIRDQLGFNYKLGHQRPGCQPNITIGRFYRMLVNNIAGFKLGTTDMSTHGQMFRAVAPENDQVCDEIGWKTMAEEQGFEKGENVVSITSGRAMSEPVQSFGDKAEQHLDYITDRLAGLIEPYECMRRYMETHVLFMPPVVARLLAAQGYDKDGISDYIKSHAKVTAEYFELNSSRFLNWSPYSLKDAVARGELTEEWYESDDPKRLVPLMSPRARVVTIIVGDMTRNRNQLFRENYTQGKLTSKKIILPEKWEELLARQRNK